MRKSKIQKNFQPQTAIFRPGHCKSLLGNYIVGIWSLKFGVWSFLFLAILSSSFAQQKPSSEPKNLILNGDFEIGKNNSPAGWQPVDGLATFWVKDPDPAGKNGKVIMIDSDIYADQARDWWKRFMTGSVSASAAPKKRITSGNKYDTIAGLEGVHFYTDFFPIDPEKSYRLSVDFRGKWADGAIAFVPKLWLRCYKEKVANDPFGVKDMGDENAAIRKPNSGVQSSPGISGGSSSKAAVAKPYDYQYDLVCRGENQDSGWSHITRELKPMASKRVTFKNLKWARLCLYAYWPPGVYYFDNVKLVEISTTGK